MKTNPAAKTGITEIVVGTVILRRGRAHPLDIAPVDELLYVTSTQRRRYCVDRDGNDTKHDIWDAIRASISELPSKRRRGARSPKKVLAKKR